MSNKSFEAEIERAVKATAILADLTTAPYVKLPLKDFKALYQGAKVFTLEHELYSAALGMNRIVEEVAGVMDHGTWRDEYGVRLKDTPEWVAMYLALPKPKINQKEERDDE